MPQRICHFAGPRQDVGIPKAAYAEALRLEPKISHLIVLALVMLRSLGQDVLNLKGTIEFFIENTFNYPTLAQAYKLDAWARMVRH